MSELNPDLKKAQEAAQAARAAVNKATADLYKALEELSQALSVAGHAARNVLVAGGESKADVASYFAREAVSNSSNWSGGPTSARNIVEALTRSAALELAARPDHRLSV